jgi:SAM-dependent methyltransferase
MIDINNTIDLLKIKFFNEYLYMTHVEDEGESEFHRDMTAEVVKKYIDPLNIPKDTKILDLGCGAGYFLDQMRERGYTDLTGVTLSPGDIKTCKDKKHTVKQLDMSFLPQTDGYHDESVGFIFLRHALEHSPYPIFTLMEYNRVLVQGSKMYIEVPAPDCERKLESIANHYSIMGVQMLASLLHRTGFNIDKFEIIDVDVGIPDENKEIKNYKEKYYCIIATKAKPLDIK